MSENPEFDPETESQRERQAQWETARREVDEITDKLGKPIDEGIKEVVTAFRAHKISTSQSCEGHEHEQGATAPWVELYASAPEGWRDNDEKKREWTIENLKQQQRMIEFLSEFYQGRETPSDARFSFRYIGAFGGFRIQSLGAEVIPILSPEEQREKAEVYRKEMDDFSEFLEEKFFKK